MDNSQVNSDTDGALSSSSSSLSGLPVPATRRMRSTPLRAGEFVQVRSFAEIAATLDGRGELDGVPFMPEMLAYCGKHFEVWKRAHKTCDEAAGGVIREVKKAVHLKELRCSGEAHAGCDCGCALFWKEQWLKRIVSGVADRNSSCNGESPQSAPAGETERSALERIRRATRFARSEKEGEELFSCQATEITKFSRPLPWWNPAQYARDLLARNVTVGEFVRGIFVGVFNKLRCWLGGTSVGGVCGVNGPTPRESLSLSPGDLVRIKPKEAIVATLDRRGKNRGLSFRAAMSSYCGKQYQVARRVRRIIDPSSRRMRLLGEGSVILEGVVCTGSTRRFCPRMVYTYWRDIWLTKVVPAEPAPTHARTLIPPVEEPV